MLLVYHRHWNITWLTAFLGSFFTWSFGGIGLGGAGPFFFFQTPSVALLGGSTLRIYVKSIEEKLALCSAKVHNLYLHSPRPTSPLSRAGFFRYSPFAEIGGWGFHALSALWAELRLEVAALVEEGLIFSSRLGSNSLLAMGRVAQ